MLLGWTSHWVGMIANRTVSKMWPLNSDKKLLRGIRRREVKALQSLMDRYADELFLRALYLLDGVGGASDAEECVAQLFVAVWEEIEEYDEQRASPRTWLHMRLRYIALDCRRRLERERRLRARVSQEEEEIIPEGVEAWLERQERRRRVREALLELDELNRSLVYDRYFLDYSLRELAEETGMTEAAVESRLRRAREKLRRHLLATDEVDWEREDERRTL